jgi:hypothetical protein
VTAFWIVVLASVVSSLIFALLCGRWQWLSRKRAERTRIGWRGLGGDDDGPHIY